MTGVRFLLLQLTEETRLMCMLRSGRCYQPEEMGEVVKLLKAWMAKEQQHKQEHGDATCKKRRRREDVIKSVKLLRE